MPSLYLQTKCHGLWWFSSVKISHLECQLQLPSLLDYICDNLVIIQEPSGISTYQMNELISGYNRSSIPSYFNVALVSASSLWSQDSFEFTTVVGMWWFFINKLEFVGQEANMQLWRFLNSSYPILCSGAEGITAGGLCWPSNHTAIRTWANMQFITRLSQASSLVDMVAF